MVNARANLGFNEVRKTHLAEVNWNRRRRRFPPNWNVKHRVYSDSDDFNVIHFARIYCTNLKKLNLLLKYKINSSLVARQISCEKQVLKELQIAI